MTEERKYEVMNARAEVLEKQGHFQLADALREQAELILLKLSTKKVSCEPVRHAPSVQCPTDVAVGQSLASGLCLLPKRILRREATWENVV